MTMAIKRLSLFDLKLIMLVAMVIDHVAWAFVATDSIAGELMHTIGRMVAPMMAYFLAMGFVSSRNVMRYLGRLFGFALISQPVFMWFQYQIGMADAIGDVIWGNVLFTLTVSLAVLMVWRQAWPMATKVMAVIGLCLVADLSEYGMAMVLWACIFDRLMAHKARMLAVFALSLPMAYLLIYGVNATVGLGFMHLGWLFVIPLILLHNGTKGRRLGGRYFFYVFYPVHMAVIAAMVWIYDRWWGF